ncbi:MAG: heterodisulfide reductase subunit B [Deltaproteobacteria bacterium]|nr:heterodisulfide reductase subunit B [Deltaproteobacteria bacterium]
MSPSRFAYYPGCAAEATVKEADRAMRAIAPLLGLELHPFESMTCCGAGVLHEEQPDVSLALNARNLAIAERAGLDLLTLCNTCLLTMLKAQHELRSNPQLAGRINESLARFDLRYEGRVKVRHLLWVLAEDVGPEAIRALVKKPLAGLRIAPFYGCHILRPEEVLGFEDGRDPNSMERIIEALGAEPVRYDARTECCGFHVMLVNAPATTTMVGHCLEGAVDKRADVMVTPCTLCQLTLDSYQYRADKTRTQPLKLPVLHLPQLLGMAFGLDGKTLGLNRHLVAVAQ